MTQLEKTYNKCMYLNQKIDQSSEADFIILHFFFQYDNLLNDVK